MCYSTYKKNWLIIPIITSKHANSSSYCHNIFLLQTMGKLKQFESAFLKNIAKSRMRKYKKTNRVIKNCYQPSPHIVIGFSSQIFDRISQSLGCQQRFYIWTSLYSMVKTGPKRHSIYFHYNTKCWKLVMTWYHSLLEKLGLKQWEFNKEN